MVKAIIYLHDADGDNCGAGEAHPTKSAALTSARLAAKQAQRDIIVQRLHVEGPDLRRLLCAVNNHSGYVRRSEDVGVMEVVEERDEDGYLVSDPVVVWNPC